MINKLNLEWFAAALNRAIRTMAQTALSMFTVGVAVNEIDWVNVASISAVAGLFSLLTSVATSLPEVGSDGYLEIDESGPTDRYLMNFTTDLDEIKKKTAVKFTVKTGVVLPAIDDSQE
jgi:hypothetical protein